MYAVSYDEAIRRLYDRLGDHAKMVLSTSLHDEVGARMMSFIIRNGIFYFQTDRRMRKYVHIAGNPRVALCMENIQIEGICKEFGHPSEDDAFCSRYKHHFPNSYEKYTMLENERLFAIAPSFAQMWIYEEGTPFVERIDFARQIYIKEEYIGELA